MKTWQLGLMALLGILAGLLGFVATRPSHFMMARSVEIAAPPEKIYALVADFHEWPKWSPWDKKDPAMKKTYSGAATGVGQVYAWEGNRDVGKGRMTLLALEPGKLVRVKLEFLDPGPFTNDTHFAFIASGDKTNVFWTLEGESDGLLQKAMSLLMDRMVGPDFEAGLARMKSAAETK